MITSQDKILNYCIKNAVFDGWNTQLLAEASKNAGLEADYWRILFPAGVVDLLDFWVDESNKKMEAGADLTGARTPEKIKRLIKFRLEAEEAHKESIRSAMAVYALNPFRGIAANHKIVDSIWHAAGDTSTDWNYYSKRLILSGVYSSTLVYWLNDKSEGHEKTWEFLDNRLANVAQFGKFTNEIKSRFAK